MGWAWIQTIESNRWIKNVPSIKAAGAALILFIILAIDNATAENTFLDNVSDQKFEQNYIQSSYEELYKISKKIRESGDDVNIIIHKNSRLSANRHLNRIPYKSLIEYKPSLDEFIVEDGANKDLKYTPKKGDIIASLDKHTDLLKPIIKNFKTELVYRHNPSKRSGVILKITDINQAKINK